jgi:DNA-binding transcriptional LysR family regulator
LARLRYAVEAARRAASGDAGHLAIGVTGSAMFGVVPSIIRAFRHRHPGITVELRLNPKGEQEKGLRERRLAVGFVRSLSDDPELTYELVLEESLILAVSTSNPLAARDVLTLEDLRNEGFILYRGQSSPSLADQITHVCQEAGFSPRIVQETEDMQSAAALAALDLGITLVAESLRHMHLADLSYRSLSGPRPGPTTRLYAVFRREDQSPVLHAFRTVCREMPLGSTAPANRGAARAPSR